VAAQVPSRIRSIERRLCVSTLLLSYPSRSGSRCASVVDLCLSRATVTTRNHENVQIYRRVLTSLSPSERKPFQRLLAPASISAYRTYLSKR
jgi:hypothetical protein